MTQKLGFPCPAADLVEGIVYDAIYHSHAPPAKPKDPPHLKGGRGVSPPPPQQPYHPPNQPAGQQPQPQPQQHGQQQGPQGHTQSPDNGYVSHTAKEEVEIAAEKLKAIEAAAEKATQKLREVDVADEIDWSSYFEKAGHF